MSGEDLVDSVQSDLMDKLPDGVIIMATIKTGWNEDGWFDPIRVMDVKPEKYKHFAPVIRFMAKNMDGVMDHEICELHIEQDSITIKEI